MDSVRFLLVLRYCIWVATTKNLISFLHFFFFWLPGGLDYFELCLKIKYTEICLEVKITSTVTLSFSFYLC